jgi:release factor glutamine methyltransferase
MGASGARSRYLPAEDTRELSKALESFSGGACLEIGFGSGAVLKGVSKRFGLVVGTDVIGLEDSKRARSPGIDLVLADAATCFRDEVFDLVFFNPPYLPSEGIVDAAVDGGRGGIEVATSFFEGALGAVKKDGVVVALMSDAGDLRSFVDRCEEAGAEVEEIARKKLFYESLIIFRMKRLSSREGL